MSGSEKSRRWYGLSSTVFLIGILSFVLSLWVERIYARPGNNFFLVTQVIWALIVVSATAGLWNRERKRIGSEEELSFRLLTAQEMERKRIAMELHDELGQALSVTKLRIRVIEKGLGEDQQTIRKECEELLGYMDHVIEDVRRLSLALSPTVLEDLGLTSALRWLISNFSVYSDISVTSDIAEIDHFFPRNQWITIYRVVQETLTNIGKHAQARNIAVVIRHDDDKVIFSVEDDGKGFDPQQVALRDASEKGFGLTTMDERMRMIGGDVDLWSQEGKGTRVTFSIPVGKGVA